MEDRKIVYAATAIFLSSIFLSKKPRPAIGRNLDSNFGVT